MAISIDFASDWLRKWSEFSEQLVTEVKLNLCNPRMVYTLIGKFLQATVANRLNSPNPLSVVRKRCYDRSMESKGVIVFLFFLSRRWRLVLNN